MNRYQLAKIVSWAGHLDSRKRLQKVVYMLKAAGCPLEADYYLHHYGPYSEDVARLTDEMVSSGLLDEKEQQHSVGRVYSYRLSKGVAEKLADVEQQDSGRQWNSELSPFEATAKELLQAELRKVEYASTIVYFLKAGSDWTEAVAKAVEFKGTPEVRKAIDLAQKVVGV